jgi:hypothetical protein
MQEHAIPYIIVMPRYEKGDSSWMETRNEYMKRYLSRGNSYAFIQKIYNNWKDWMEEMLYHDPAPTIQIHRLLYLNDIFNVNYVPSLQGL